MRLIRLLVFLSLFILVSLISFLGGYFYHSYENPPFLSGSIVEEAYKILATHALSGIPDSPMFEYGVIRGMVTTLNDPYTIFVEPDPHELETDNLRGEFGGIGVRIERNFSGFLVMYPFPDSPAEKSGIRMGDYLTGVDQLQIDEQTPLETVEAALRGEVGKPVEIKYRKADKDQDIRSTIIRTTIAIPSVTWNIDQDENKLGVVQISRFASTTPAETVTAIETLQSKGATYFVLDLRNNPGGLLDAGVETARLFLESGVVLVQQYKNQPETNFEVKSPGLFSSLPIAIIVNNGTTSAAEVLAGSIQAHRRGHVFGQPTYGKDTLQLVFDLSDQSSLHVTAARWWIPDLDPPIAGNGVIPDFITSTDPETIKPEIQEIIKDFALNS